MSAGSSRDVTIDCPGITLQGMLALPDDARGIVVFVHGSGSSRFSSRNAAVARALNDIRLGTLLFDLLTVDEEEVDRRTRHLRFDIDLLTERLWLATEWLRERSGVPGDLPLGYFGSSTGAAAAIKAAARHPDAVAAVVSRGGRPDLAGDDLQRLRAATLLIVGGHDVDVLRLNEDALRQMRQAQAQLVIVPGATHLFEEPGTLEQAARAAGRWFAEAFGDRGRSPAQRRQWITRPRRGGRFADRIHAGELLAERLRDEVDDELLSDAIVVGMPRGGVPVAKVVADAFDLPLTAVLARKIGAPGHPEYGIGAVAEDGVVLLDEEAAHATGAEGPVLERIVDAELVEMERRRQAYLGDGDQPSFAGRAAILVDDGLATGVTARAAGGLLRRRGASRVLLAVPVCAPSSVEQLRDEFDDVVCVEQPPDFHAVGLWYEDFDQTSDREVIEALRDGVRR